MAYFMSNLYSLGTITVLAWGNEHGDLLLLYSSQGEGVLRGICFLVIANYIIRLLDHLLPAGGLIWYQTRSDGI